MTVEHEEGAEKTSEERSGKKSTSREYAESILVAVVIAVALRAFVVEPFKIPTESMVPTLKAGDHIFVSKFIYGLRIPFTNEWFTNWASPDRGDVIVFRYPRDLSKDYIKRVVAVAGDRVRVEGIDVYVNDLRLERADGARYEYLEEGEDKVSPLAGHAAADLFRIGRAYAETSLGAEHTYTVLYTSEYSHPSFPRRERLPGLRCRPTTFTERGECVVEDGYVFVMGDNRDNSSDSRVWGGVPITYVKGKAMVVWWSIGALSGPRWGRIGHAVH